jgi:acyl-CoA thioesterase-1
VEDREKNNFPTKLGALLGPTFVVNNYGKSGVTLAKNGDHPYWTTDEFMAATNSSPDVVIIMLGTNDTKPQNWHGPQPFGKDLGLLIDHFRRLPTKPLIWVCLPVPIYKDEWGITAATLNNGVIPEIMKVCTDKNVPVIDLSDALTNPQLFPDGIHPNAAGADLMARTIYQAIRP